MKKAAFGLMIGLGAVMAIGTGSARAEKAGADKSADKTHATSQQGAATELSTAKDKKTMGNAAAAGKNTKPGTMMCEDFLSLDEVTKPKVVYWAEGFTKKGKPDDAVFDVESTERLVPTLVEVCRKEPKSSFMKTVKSESKAK